LRGQGKKIESETITESHLGKLSAARLIVTYTCLGSDHRYLKSSVMALSADKRFIYTLEIHSPADRFENDRAVLDQIVHSWNMISASRRQRRR
jgi:hypothetical protein